MTSVNDISCNTVVLTVYFLTSKSFRCCLCLSSTLWMSILRNPPLPMDFYSYLVDRNLETSTGPDLEAIVRDCLCAHKRWGDPSLARVRGFKRAERREPITILPGGRWAIMFASMGSALAVDLHTPDYQSSPLFLGYTEKRPVAITPVMETQEAGFHTQLKIAVFYRFAYDVHIRMWLIRPSYDSAGRSVPSCPVGNGNTVYDSKAA